MNNENIIRFLCPDCSQSLEAESIMSGKVINCPSCQKSITTLSPITSKPKLILNENHTASKHAKMPQTDTLSCKYCAAKLPLDAVICVQCNRNLKTGVELPPISKTRQTLGNRSTLSEFTKISPEPYTSSTALKRQLNSNTLSLGAILRLSFNGEMIPETVVYAIKVLLRFLFLALLLFILGVLLRVGSSILLVIMFLFWLFFCVWTAQQYFAIAEQYESGAVVPNTNKSKFTCFWMYLAVCIISILPILTGSFGVLWFYLYFPMGVAMAGAYDVINPFRVLRSIIRTFPGYFILLLYYTSFWSASFFAGVIFLYVMEHWVHVASLKMIAWIVVIIIVQVVSFSQVAMVGALLRRYKNSRRLTGNEIAESLLYTVFSIVLALVLGLVMFRLAPELKPFTILKSSIPNSRNNIITEKPAQTDPAGPPTGNIEEIPRSNGKPYSTDNMSSPITDSNLESATSRQNQQTNFGPITGNDWIVPDNGTEFVWIKALNCWVGKYEVTNGEYRKFKENHDSRDFKGYTLNGDRQPVVYVNYDDACEYAKWLTLHEREKGRLPAGYSYRIPSDKEWTVFCQCGDNRVYPWGNSMPPKYGNYFDKRIPVYIIFNYNDGFLVTCPVEKSGKNDWGLYGVGGNVFECTVKSSVDLSFDAWRGGAWGSYHPDNLHSSFRFDNLASERSIYNGFRLLLSLPTEQYGVSRQQQVVKVSGIETGEMKSETSETRVSAKRIEQTNQEVELQPTVKNDLEQKLEGYQRKIEEAKKLLDIVKKQRAQAKIDYDMFVTKYALENDEFQKKTSNAKITNNVTLANDSNLKAYKAEMDNKKKNYEVLNTQFEKINSDIITYNRFISKYKEKN